MTGIFVPLNDGPKSPGWIEDGSGCHIWTGALSGSGYAQSWIKGQLEYVHRIRYRREVGPISPGMELDHLCENRACVNPAHCRPVTRWENTMRSRSVVARNYRKTHCPQGHELAGGNVLWQHGGIHRRCRTCHNRQGRERWARRKAERLEGNR